ncbi:MAG TPA: ATP-binding protein [Puia sp.]|nr:ATP-binding protein [Puia sp.]
MNQVVEFFSRLFDTTDWPPRWHCGRWTDFHGWLYIISDLLIWSAYFAIPAVIIRYLSRKQDIRFVRIYFLFAAFILACGATHFLDAIAFWIPAYRFNAFVLLITGILSWVTVFQLIKILPHAFSLKSGTELEKLVAERTAELTKSHTEIADYKYALDESAIVAITNQKGIITHVNQNFCKISKYDANELLGKDHRIINSGFHPKEYIRDIWVTIANGRIWKGELKNKAKDGSFYWVDTTIVPFLGEDNKPYQYVAIRADITGRKRVEEAYLKLNEDLERRIALRTAQLEAATKEMEAFTYSVSHDLRAPLRGIIGFANVLEEEYAEKIDDDGRRVISIIKKNTLKMGHLIDDLLSFSRIGKAEMRKSMINMQEMASTVVEDEMTNKDTTRIRWNIQPLPPAAANPETIRQVWVNLISNAVKYSATRQEAHIQIGGFVRNEEKVFFVKDNGVGFDSRYKDKLFRVFQRLHSPDDFEGTGIGLALVEKIVSKHGGRVWAEGEPDKGACFYFSLPSPARDQREAGSP